MFHLTKNGCETGACRTTRETGIEQLLDEMTRGFGYAVAPRGAAEIVPAFDVSETAGEWRVRAELAGVAPEDVEVSVTENVLTIRGEKKPAAKTEGENLRRDERRFGKFARTLEFPGDIDGSKVAAKFQHGVLVVTLAKAEASKPKTVSIKVE